MSNASTAKSEKPKAKKPRQKRHDLGKLSAALQVATAAIAEAANVSPQEVDLYNVNSSIAKATVDISKAIGISPEKLKLSISFTGNTEAAQQAS